MNPRTPAGQNPYLQVLAQMQGGQSAGMPGGPAGRAGAGPAAGGPAAAMQGGMPGGAPRPGTVGQAMQQQGAGAGAGVSGPTKLLLGALQSLHTAIQSMQDPQEVAILRSVIVLLTGLIQKDQARLQQGGGQATPQPLR